MKNLSLEMRHSISKIIQRGFKISHFQKQKKSGNWLKYFRLGTQHIYSHHPKNLPLVKNVGFCLPMGDGRGPAYLVLPSMHEKSFPYGMANVKVTTDDGQKRKKSSWIQRAPKEVKAYVKGMPKPLLESTECAQYYFEDGHRKVTPYYYVFEAYFESDQLEKLKNSTVADYYMANIPQCTREFLQYRIDQRHIFVNLEPIESADHPLRKFDHLSGIVHTHERPVLDTPVNVIYEDEDILVVNKPASMLIYPSNGYRLNTVIYILAHELGHRDLRLVHRLDKVTSGVLVLAKASGENYAKFIQEFKENHSKEYLAMVDGDFPDTPPEGLSCDHALYGFETKHGTTKKSGSPRESLTKFHKLSTIKDSNSEVCSLVRCVPVQGRTHQIRIHLQSLGYPIVNDHLYNPRDNARWQNSLDMITSLGYKCLTESKSTKSNSKEGYSSHSTWKEKLTENIGSPRNWCYTCFFDGKYDEWSIIEPKFICLHSWKYSTGGSKPKEFVAPKPQWATDHNFLKNLLAERKTEPKWLDLNGLI